MDGNFSAIGFSWWSGLVKFDGTNWTTYNTSNSGLPQRRYLFHSHRWNGTKWIGTSSGLGVFNENGIPFSVKENITSKSNLILYPNPAKDKITISHLHITGITQLSIFNVNGEKVMEKQLTNNETQIDISALPRGVYFVRVQNEKMVEVAKMVKE